MLINTSIQLNPAEAKLAREVIVSYRKDANTAYLQYKDICKLMSQGMDLVDAMIASKETTAFLKARLSAMEAEDGEYEAEFLFQILEESAESNFPMPVVLEDHRLVFSEVELYDVANFINTISYEAYSYEEEVEVDEDGEPLPETDEEIIEQMKKWEVCHALSLKILGAINASCAKQAEE